MSAVRIASRLAIALLLLGREARAANDRRLREQDRVAVDVALDATASPHTTELAAQQLAPTVEGSLRVARPWVVTADAALAFTSYRVGDQPRAAASRSSNVMLGVRWAPSGATADSGGDAVSLVLGAAVGAPLVTVPSGGIAASATAEQADRVALGAAGPRGTWRWARNAIPIVGLARASKGFGALRLTLELEPGLLVSVNRDSSRAAVVATAEVAVRWANVSPYAAFSCVASTRPLDGRDFAQTGAALGVRHDLGGILAWSEARLQLDGPEGVAEPNATFWGATFGLGVRM